MTQEIKKTETIEEFAQDYISSFVQLDEPQPSRITYAMTKAAKWQKEQDKELIEELLESLKTVTKIPMYRREFGNGSIDLKAQHAIAKAENYLKQ